MPKRRQTGEPATRFTMAPKDTHGLGYIFGGVILSNVDLAGAIVARQTCTGANVAKVVTRAMERVEFKHPVLVNDVLTCWSEVTRIGNTSLTVQVSVDAERGRKIIPVTSAELVFVALDQSGKPTTVLDDPSAALALTAKKQVPRKPPRPAFTLDKCQGPRVLGLKKEMLPFETNSMGNIFGGVLLSHMDMAGCYVAQRICKNRYVNRCVTRFMDRVEFKQPVNVGDVLSCYGTIAHVGRTSIGVRVEVEARRGKEIIPVTAADIVYVAVNNDGEPSPVACASRCGKKSKK